jgi:hypothetical protein
MRRIVVPGTKQVNAQAQVEASTATALDADLIVEIAPHAA